MKTITIQVPDALYYEFTEKAGAYQEAAGRQAIADFVKIKEFKDMSFDEALYHIMGNSKTERYLLPGEDGDQQRAQLLESVKKLHSWHKEQA